MMDTWLGYDKQFYNGTAFDDGCMHCIVMTSQTNSCHVQLISLGRYTSCSAENFFVNTQRFNHCDSKGFKDCTEINSVKVGANLVKHSV